MKKLFSFAVLFIGFCAASYGQQLMKIKSAPAYDNVNHDQQRAQQLDPLYNAKYALLEDKSYLPAPQLKKTSGNSSMDMLLFWNTQKIKTYPVPDYIGNVPPKTK